MLARARLPARTAGAAPRVRRRRLAAAAAVGAPGARVFAVSDVHVGYLENRTWLEALCAESRGTYANDVLIFAGDVAEELPQLEAALGAAAAAFGRVFFAPGNHEALLRERGGGTAAFADSAEKLEAVAALCARLGVAAGPERLGAGTWVAPLLSWHHADFDAEPDIPGLPRASPRTVGDWAHTRWPAAGGGGGAPGARALAEWADRQNETPAWRSMLADRAGADVLAFSHFLPRAELLPEKRFLTHPNVLPKVSGSLPLGQRVQALRPDLHVFGHTHFSWDATLDGVRYVQAPLCGPNERRRRLQTVSFGAPGLAAAAAAGAAAARWLPLEVYRFGEAPPGWRPLRYGALPPPLDAHWSSYYEHSERRPEDLRLAPWVARLYEKRARRHAAAVAAGASIDDEVADET
jgi:hypothetical protein